MDLSEREARRRLASARVARLATAASCRPPLLVPITFAVVDDAIVTAVDRKPKRTTHLRRLREIAANGHVAVLADYYDDDWTRLWWVRADGRGRVVECGPDHDSAVRGLRVKYRQYSIDPPDGPVIWIEVARWRGWSGRA